MKSAYENFTAIAPVIDLDVEWRQLYAVERRKPQVSGKTAKEVASSKLAFGEISRSNYNEAQIKSNQIYLKPHRAENEQERF